MVDAAPVFYRTVDPIENLELRVTLRCVDSGRTAQRGRNGSMASSRRMRGSSAGTGELEEKALQVGDGAGSVAGSVEERSWTQVLKWQDKVFGPREILDLAIMKNDPRKMRKASRLRLEYMDQLDRDDTDRFDPANVPPVFLHTFVDKDGYVPREDFDKRVTTADSGLSHLAEGTLKQQLRGENVTGATGTAATEQAHLFRDAPFQTYYIMATVEMNKDDFCQKNPKTKMNSKILCYVKAYTDNNLLEMAPGFSKMQTPDEPKKWYRFTTETGGVYEYFVENVSASPDDEDLAFEHMKEAQTVEHTAGRITTALEGAPPMAYSFRYHAYLEIIAAAKFDADSLFIAYDVVLPHTGWTWPERSAQSSAPDLLKVAAKSGVTQVVRPVDRVWRYDQDTRDRLKAAARKNMRYTSAALAGSSGRQSSFVTGARGDQVGGSHGTSARTLVGVTARKAHHHFRTPKESVAHFCYPIDFQLLSHIEVDPSLSAAVPIVYFTVLHRDSWGRETVQGYGTLELPLAAGSSVEVVKTWKPEGSVSQQMQEYFIGGALQLRDIALAGLPPDVKGNVLNKFGFRTVTSGHIAVRVQTAIQRRGVATERTAAVGNTNISAFIRNVLGARGRERRSGVRAMEKAGLKSPRVPMFGMTHRSRRSGGADDDGSAVGAGAGAGAGAGGARRPRLGPGAHLAGEGPQVPDTPSASQVLRSRLRPLKSLKRKTRKKSKAE